MTAIAELTSSENRKSSAFFDPAFAVRLSHFHGVARAYIICQYVLATFVIHTFKSIITSYFLNFLLNPTRPINPAHKRSMVLGSGTGLPPTVSDVNGVLVP